MCHKLASTLRKADENLLPMAESAPNLSLLVLRFSQVLLLPCEF